MITSPGRMCLQRVKKCLGAPCESPYKGVIGSDTQGNKIMRKPLVLPPLPLADIVKAIETRRGVTLAPMKGARHANS